MKGHWKKIASDSLISTLWSKLRGHVILNIRKCVIFLLTISLNQLFNFTRSAGLAWLKWQKNINNSRQKWQKMANFSAKTTYMDAFFNKNTMKGHWEKIASDGLISTLWTKLGGHVIIKIYFAISLLRRASLVKLAQKN